MLAVLPELSVPTTVGRGGTGVEAAAAADWVGRAGCVVAADWVATGLVGAPAGGGEVRAGPVGDGVGVPVTGGVLGGEDGVVGAAEEVVAGGGVGASPADGACGVVVAIRR